MTDITSARESLSGHSVVLCRGAERIISDERGVKPLVELLDSGTDCRGFSAADKIVGKAAAMLFSLLGVSGVYAAVMSEAGKAYLDSKGIRSEYGMLVPGIINHAGTGRCPMEQAVSETDDAREGFARIKERIAQLRAAAEV